jgi:Glycosyltransferase family 87
MRDSWRRESLAWATVFTIVALVVTIAVHESGRELSDTSKYAARATAIGKQRLIPYRDFDLEYPPGALPLFVVPAIPPGGHDSYYWLFICQMAVIGAIGVVLTGRSLEALGRTRRQRRAALGLVALSPVAFGSVLLTRFDLLPATLTAAALYAVLTARPRVGAAFLGLAGAVKLYPLAALPILATWVWRHYGPRQAAATSVIAVGTTALVYLPFALLAPSGVWESVWGQLSRPLHIESLGAGVLVVLHHVAGIEVTVETSSGSENLVGGAAPVAAGVLSVVGIAALGWVWFAFARGSPDRERLVRLTAAAIVSLVALGKLVSPQFLIWLLFPLAVVGARRGAAAAALFALAAVATAIWFPWRYFELPFELDPTIASLVVLRGLALVGVLAVLAWPDAPHAEKAASGLGLPHSSNRPPGQVRSYSQRLPTSKRD